VDSKIIVQRHIAKSRPSWSASERLGRLLYPYHWERVDSRRACDSMAAAARRQAEKQNAPGFLPEAFTAPRSTATGCEDGCFTECA
jgi:hypothetical protein